MTTRRGARERPREAAFQPAPPSGTLDVDVTPEEREAIEALADCIFNAWRERCVQRKMAA